jgi:hypothetical protein
MIWTIFMNCVVASGRPQGLKPSSFVALGGTAEAVPFPKPIHEEMHIADMRMEDGLMKVRRS